MPIASRWLPVEPKDQCSPEEAVALALRWAYQGIHFLGKCDRQNWLLACQSHSLSFKQSLSIHEIEEIKSEDVSKIIQIDLNFPDLKKIDELLKIGVREFEFIVPTQPDFSLSRRSQWQEIRSAFRHAQIEKVYFQSSQDLPQTLSAQKYFSQFWPELKFLPPLPSAFYPRFSILQSLRTCVLHETKLRERACLPLISIVIPMFNSSFTIPIVLTALRQQNFDASALEIILVDDSSSSFNVETILEMGRNENLNLRILCLPSADLTGQRAFRAGFARNCGAALARANHLLFLDDDIQLSSQDHLSQLLKAPRLTLQMAPRFNKSLSSQSDFASDSPRSDKAPPYWSRFYAKGEKWNTLPNPWRFACSYHFSLSRNLFWSVGGFIESFDSYGYEDQELAYRLTQQGVSFQLGPCKVWHLVPSRMGRIWTSREKRSAMIRSASRFYAATLCPEVSKHCKYLFQPLAKLKCSLHDLSLAVRSRIFAS